MSIANQLREKASQYAQHHSSGHALARLQSYLPKQSERYTCYWCWIDHEYVSMLTEQSGTDTEEHFRCPRCKGEITVLI
jgi:hypothetical protein